MSNRNLATIVGAIAAVLLVYAANPWVVPPEGTVRTLVNVGFWVAAIVLAVILFQDRKSAEADEVEIEGPIEAQLGNVVDGLPVSRPWGHQITENPIVGSTEVWEFYNTTADAHPMHVHEVTFQLVNREGLVRNQNEDEVALPIQLDGNVTPPQAGESGFKDTVIAYPGQVTRIRATFDSPGQFVWHCHIVEHEDNEMMRPMRVGPPQAGEPGL